MVVVDSVPKVERHVAEVAIVRVLLKIDDVTGANRRDDLLCNGRLARARAPADTDYHSVVIIAKYRTYRTYKTYVSALTIRGITPTISSVSCFPARSPTAITSP